MTENSTTAGADALRAALTKLGDPYVWGAAGPDAFDCSGLETWAYGMVGIVLPHSTYITYKIAPVALNAPWLPGDLCFIRGSDPGPNGEPGHTGMFVGIGDIHDPAQHTFTPDAGGRPVFLNAPYTGDPGGVRFDYFSSVLFHTRPELLLPSPPPAPVLPPPSGAPSPQALAQTGLVLLPNVAAAQLALKNGWALWYWSKTQFFPQVGGKPTGCRLYANRAYAKPKVSDLP